MIIRVHQKDEQSAVVMSVHGTTLCRDFRSFTYVGARAKSRARKQLSEDRIPAEVRSEFCVARVIRSARSPLSETENLRPCVPQVRTSHADGRQFAVHEIESPRGDLRNSAFALETKAHRTEGMKT